MTKIESREAKSPLLVVKIGCLTQHNGRIQYSSPDKITNHSILIFELSEDEVQPQCFAEGSTTAFCS